MIQIPFTPPNASMNRVRIMDLPGITMDEGVRGQQAYHLLSAHAVAKYAREAADALGLPEAYRDTTADTAKGHRELPRYVDACLHSQDLAVQAAAEDIAHRLGRNLGHILLTLHRGDAVNRAARPDWTEKEWENWASIRHVWIGGGLMSGSLGQRVVNYAREFLAETGYDARLHVTRSPYARDVALLGAARYMPMTTGQALCMDFGHTATKRAIVDVKDGTLTQLTSYSPIVMPWNWENRPDAATDVTGSDVLHIVARTISETLKSAQTAGAQVSDDLIMSIAAYVRGGQLLGNGIYARMCRLTEDVRLPIARAVEEHSGRAMRIHIIHDGTAAATLHAGTPNTAVLIIGTAIGVGFPPSNTVGLRPLSEALQEAHSTATIEVSNRAC